jgi:hypothetical protein
MKNICICGGGNEAHALAAYLSNRGNNVYVLTRKPERWNNKVVIHFGEKTHEGKIYVSDNPAEVVPKASLILLSVPSYAYEDILKKITEYINPASYVGAIPGTGGFDYFCKKYLNPKVTYFSSQRVPFVARIREYGNSVDISGLVHGNMKYAVSNDEHIDSVLSIMSEALHTQSSYLPSFLCVNLVNSNSLLHTTRLYSLGNGSEFWKKPPLFYGEWDDYSSELFIKSDNELFNLFNNISAIDFSCMTTALEHYESTNAVELTQKIRSIESLKRIKTPTTIINANYMLDFSSRYFIEDFPYGIALISVVAKKYGIETKCIDMITDWGLNSIGKDISYVQNLFGEKEFRINDV